MAEKGPGSLRGPCTAAGVHPASDPLIAFSLVLLEQIATNLRLNGGAHWPKLGVRRTNPEAAVLVGSAISRRSLPGLGRHKSQLFWSKRPINGALRFRYSLSLRRGLACCLWARVQRDRPLPDVPTDALNDGVVDAAMFHGIKIAGAMPCSADRVAA
jgi:hypothetical protein